MVSLDTEGKVAESTKVVTMLPAHKRTALKQLQKEFLENITALSPLLNDLGVMGCEKCDIRVRKLQSPAFTINQGLVKKQIKFIPPKGKETKGVFQFNRIFYDSYNHLASFAKESYKSAENTSQKLAKYPIARSDLNWKLSSDYLECYLYTGWLLNFSNTSVNNIHMKKKKYIINNLERLNRLYRLALIVTGALSLDE